MKSIRKHTMYLGNRIFGIVYVYLIGMLFLSACAEGERYINNEEESIVALEEVPNSETIYQENIAETRTVENVTSELTSYSYEVEKDVFSFSTSEDKTYYVPYVKISGCSNEKLQWNINHTLWEDACWILDCAEIGDPCMICLAVKMRCKLQEFININIIFRSYMKEGQKVGFPERLHMLLLLTC